MPSEQRCHLYVSVHKLLIICEANSYKTSMFLMLILWLFFIAYY